MFLTLFLSLPISTNLFGQVVIKERVKIEPKENFGKKKLNQVQTEYLPCGPYPQGTSSLFKQVVWLGSSYPLDVEQHAFNIQDNVKTATTYNAQYRGIYQEKVESIQYSFEVISGFNNCTILEYFPWYGSMENYIPPEEVFGLINLTLPEMVGDANERGPYWEQEIIDGECVNCYHQYMLIQGVKTSIEFLKYRLFFNEPGIVLFKTTAFIEMESGEVDTLSNIYETTIVEPDYELNYISDTEIPYLEEVEINVEANMIQCSFVDEWAIQDTNNFIDSTLYQYVYSGNGGSLPLENKFNVSIIEGSEYGTLTYLYDDDPYNAYKEEGASFSNLDDIYGLKFLTNGEYPSDTSKVKLRFTTTGPSNVTPIDVEIPIIENPNYPIKVNIVPNTLFAGDTATITLEKRTSEFWHDEPIYEPFEDEQEFNLSIVKGVELGRLYSGYEGNESDEFLYITQEELLFIADTNVTIDEILIKASTEIGDEQWDPLSNNKKGKRKKRGNSLQGIAPPTGGATIYGIGKIKGGMEIMLGETKYFGLKKKEDKNEIAEIPTEYGVKPEWTTLTDGWDWEKNSSVWGERPIDAAERGTSPIFYDKFFGVISISGSTKPVIEDLPAGMIRVIGRYWEEGKDSKVKLISQNNTEMKIEVIKPSKLGNEPYLVTGPTIQDNVDKEYDVDDIVIQVAGKIGIPPQIIRALIAKESGANATSYRYEPFRDMDKTQKKKNFDETHRYWIESESNLGDPTIPKHNNLYDALGSIDNYPGYISVWDFYNDKKNMYSINIPAYENQNKKWETYKVEHEKYLTNLTSQNLSEQEIKELSKSKADDRYAEYLRKDIGEKGMVGTVAQTRISASYGLMQLTYYGAVDAFVDSYNVEYPNNNSAYLPEYLMIPDINIEYAVKHLLGKLRNKLGSVVYTNEDTWIREYALETSYWKAFLGYNGGGDEGYPNSVLSKVINYLPSKD